jgi:hypothetical protein
MSLRVPHPDARAQRSMSRRWKELSRRRSARPCRDAWAGGAVNLSPRSHPEGPSSGSRRGSAQSSAALGPCIRCTRPTQGPPALSPPVPLQVEHAHMRRSRPVAGSPHPGVCSDASGLQDNAWKVRGYCFQRWGAGSIVSTSRPPPDDTSGHVPRLQHDASFGGRTPHEPHARSPGPPVLPPRCCRWRQCGKPGMM